jgi:AraC-like DNA-binding protein
LESTKYQSAINGEFDHDKLGSFLNSLEIIPHGFGHQSGLGNNSTNGYRMIGDFEIIYFLGGCGHINVGTRKYRCGRGDLIFIPPFVKHSIDSDADDPHDNYWMHFDIYPLSSRQRFISLFTEGEEYHTKIIEKEEMGNIYKNLESGLGKPGFLTLFKASILLILVSVLNETSKDARDLYSGELNPEKISFIDKIISYIYGSSEEKCSAGDICRRFGISRTSLRDLFIEATGVSPGKMVRYIRMKKAEQYLLTTDMRIEEIAQMLGYSSASNFSKAFKDDHGTAPDHFRRMQI